MPAGPRLLAAALVVAAAALAAGIWHPWSARARASTTHQTAMVHDASTANHVREPRNRTGACIPYATTHVPAETLCMEMPWVLAGAGPGARSVEITLARGCFGGFPTARVVETRAAIRIHAFAWHPAIAHGRLDMTCGAGGIDVMLHSPIAGRRIEGESPRGRLRFDPRFPLPSPLGLPRLLGLSPADAIRTLSLYGFRAKRAGTGREIVAQVPGWGLFGTRRLSPVRYPGITRLVVGDRIEIPAKPHIPPATATGLLVGAIHFDGGPVGSPRPIAGVVDVFGARGQLLARFAVRARHYFRLRLAPGRYVLLSDVDYSCGPVSAQVRAGRQAHVTVGTGCDII